jgi:class 3 adenylate cyclase/alpha-beta hydrolase superfamily lysophospholipase
MTVPRVRYARREGTSLAFQVAGSGVGLLLMAGASGTSVTWRDEIASEFFEELARFTSLVTFEQRGAGLSDPLERGRLQTLEERVGDSLAVLDAADLDRPFVVATHDGGPVALLAVTTQPERFRGLILLNTAPRLRRAPDYPGGLDDATAAWFVEQMHAQWGTGWSVNLFAPSFAAMPDGRERWARLEQGACSPGQAKLQTEQALATDARHLLELVTIPTLIIQHRDDPAVPPGNGRYLADHITDSVLVELPGNEHMPWSGGTRATSGAIRWFVGHEATPPADPRRLAAVVFTDIVRSTAALRQLGDTRWAAVLDAHDAAASALAETHEGRLVKCTGDGTLCCFNGPEQAVRYALALREEVVRLGLEMRAGVHVGEIVPRGDDVAGIAVHAAARVSALASDGNVYVSRTVTDLLAGSEILFAQVGQHALKGLPGTWEIFRVEVLAGTAGA